MKAYLDNAATTRLHADVIQAMTLSLPVFGNPSSLHACGREAHELLEEARTAVGKQLGGKPEGVIFTGSATEANNLAVLGAARARRDRGMHVITSSIEHSALRGPCKQLEREGFEVTEIPVSPEGLIDPGQVAGAVRDDTTLVSIMLANNEIGSVQPLREIREAIGDIPFHGDAAQACGKIRLDIRELPVDLLTLSGHKMHGPRGVGVLYRSPDVSIHAIQHGGSHEGGFRPGTENVVSAVGFAKSFAMSHQHLSKNVERMEGFRKRLLEGVRATIPDIVIHGPEDPAVRLPSILNFSLPGVSGEGLVLALDARDVAASAGSACESRNVEPSHVLLAMGVSRDLALASLRLSVASDTEAQEIEHALEVLPDVVRRLRR